MERILVVRSVRDCNSGWGIMQGHQPHWGSFTKKMKIDFLIIIKFNKNFSTLSAEKFIKKIIYEKTKSRYLYVSRNFKFGYKRQGNIKTLRKFEKLFDYKRVVTTSYKKKKKKNS